MGPINYFHNKIFIKPKQKKEIANRLQELGQTLTGNEYYRELKRQLPSPSYYKNSYTTHNKILESLNKQIKNKKTQNLVNYLEKQLNFYINWHSHRTSIDAINNYINKLVIMYKINNQGVVTRNNKIKKILVKSNQIYSKKNNNPLRYSGIIRKSKIQIPPTRYPDPQNVGKRMPNILSPHLPIKNLTLPTTPNRNTNPYGHWGTGG